MRFVAVREWPDRQRRALALNLKVQTDDSDVDIVDLGSIGPVRASATRNRQDASMGSSARGRDPQACSTLSKSKAGGTC